MKLAKIGIIATNVALGFSFFAPITALAVTFSGTWAVSGTLGRPVVGTVSPVCVFRQSGRVISGTCKGPNSAGPIVGSVTGFTVAWQWRMTKITQIGVSGITTFHGTLGADGVIRGTWEYPGYAALGTFTAQRVR